MRYLVWLTDGTLMTVAADRCRHERTVVTFEDRAGPGRDGWREVSVLRWEDVRRVELI